jgi:hypothetical protein
VGDKQQERIECSVRAVAIFALKRMMMYGNILKKIQLRLAPVYLFTEIKTVDYC